MYTAIIGLLKFDECHVLRSQLMSINYDLITYISGTVSHVLKYAI